MNGVFLDAVGLIALWNRRDQWHEAAGSAFAGIASGESLVTTSYIIGECGNAFSRSEIRTLLIDLTERLDADGTLIFPATPTGTRRGWPFAAPRLVRPV